jgi:NAD(P)-dependent dehydrogenase (short-subunit alcohol dehydrogenase family)
MTTALPTSSIRREPELLGQTVVMIGGSAGIGFETARRARAEGASVILTARNSERLQHAAGELGALSSVAFDAADPAALDRFFRDLPEPIDHVMVTAGRPYYARLAELDRERAHRDYDEHLWLSVAVAQHAVGRVRPGGTLLFMGGTGGRRRGPGLSLIGSLRRPPPRCLP